MEKRRAYAKHVAIEAKKRTMVAAKTIHIALPHLAVPPLESTWSLTD